ncbi:hypothetical protein ACTSKR_00685 [Chitinibacteraceae bacterium HSL-7]
MLFDRLFHALLGALFGALWGLALTWLLAMADLPFGELGRLVVLAGAVFAAFGLVFGRFVLDLGEAALYAWCGLLEVIDAGCNRSSPSAAALLRTMFVLGAGTGIVLLLVSP